MSAQEEGHVDLARVRYREGLAQRALAFEGVGHLKAEIIRITRTHLRSAVEAERHGTVGVFDYLVLIVTGDAMATHVALSLGGHRESVAKVSHDGEEDGGAARPPLGVRLPQVLDIVADEACELGALASDCRGELSEGDLDN